MYQHCTSSPCFPPCPAGASSPTCSSCSSCSGWWCTPSTSRTTPCSWTKQRNNPLKLFLMTKIFKYKEEKVIDHCKVSRSCLEKNNQWESFVSVRQYEIQNCARWPLGHQNKPKYILKIYNFTLSNRVIQNCNSVGWWWWGWGDFLLPFQNW